ncbi:MAG: hypothetical protein IJW90_01345 [Clostridia bacterium]|nr:hypothetical protein [Clostridia bacterium]
MKHPSSDTPISRGHDNLFVYSKTKPFFTLDDNEFVVKRLSPDTDAFVEKAAQAAVKKDSIPWPLHLLYAALLLSLLPIQWLIETLLPEVHYGLWGRIIYYSIIFIFLIIVVVIGRKLQPSNKQRTLMLAASNAAIRAELGIPEAAREIDVLPFTYKNTNQGPAPGHKDGHFDNIPICIWRDNDDLCLSDEDILIRFPIKAVKKIRKVERKVHVSAWYKAYTYDSPAYKSYTKDNFWYGIDILTYVEVEIRSNNESKYLLIPGYDASTFCELADPTRIS